MESNPSFFKGCDNCPVDRVRWDDVQKFIEKLNESNKKKWRLPTEVEWEYAARSRGMKEKWSGTSNGLKLKKYAWYKDNSAKKTHPVGKKMPNILGLYDMSGNVWEWVQDRYSRDYYKGSPRNSPRGPSSGEYRVIRGGSWFSEARNLRASMRDSYMPVNMDFSVGFRLALSPK